MVWQSFVNFQGGRFGGKFQSLMALHNNSQPIKGSSARGSANGLSQYLYMDVFQISHETHSNLRLGPVPSALSSIGNDICESTTLI